MSKPVRRSPAAASRNRRVALAAALAGIVPLALCVPGAASAATTPKAVTDPAAMVNPLIGTSGYVDDFAAADVPFGMVQWGPDTPSRPAGGGYEYNDHAVTGFSLTHVSGPGCGAAGDVPILPVSGAVPANPDAATLPLDHAAEHASAGEYQLTANGIDSELSTTQRSGMGRFTFPKGPQADLLLKLSDSQAGTDATHFQVVGPREVAGWVTSGHFCGATDEYTVYFDIVVDHPITASGVWHNGDTDAGVKQLTVRGHHVTATQRDADPTHDYSNGSTRATPVEHGRGVRAATVTPKAKAAGDPPVTGASGAYLSFATAKSNVVQAKVGVSYVSTANAKRNRAAENSGWDFDSVASAAHDAWNDMLGRIAITGGTPSEQTVFYTALYHSLLHPNIYSDSNGQYLGFDGQEHRVPAGHVEYTNFSGWDIYRSQAQLEALLAPDISSDEVRSMLDQYDQTGQLPKWELNNGESYIMVGDPSDSVIADAYAFGARDFDTAHALDAMLTEANVPNNVRPALSAYENKGYIPMDGTYGCCNFYGPVSTQQEYNTADYSISSFAKALGDSSDAATFARRANNWQNVFNPATGFLQPKDANGEFAPNFDPAASFGFVEGNSYQYTPMSPHDLAGLVAADGGRAAWIKKLNGLTAKVKNIDSDNADFGNEPSIEIPWEYDYVGAPWRTQRIVRTIQQQIFPDAPAGIAGNDDLGTMSAWYVWSALGMYPETPGTNDLALGSPVFDAATVSMGNGKTLTINGHGAAANAPYVHGMTVDGSAWNNAWLDPSVLTDGGTVDVTLGTTPDKSWASAAAAAPPSDTSGLAPALGYSDEPNVIVAPGKSATVTLGVRSLAALGRQTVSWTSTAPDGGAAAAPSSGSMYVAPKRDGQQTVTITAPSAEGRYPVTFSMRGADGTAMPDVVVEVDVAKPGSLWPYYSNAGISEDGVSNQGNFDGDGWSYSAQSLAAQGVTPGATITADGVDFLFPDTQPGEEDNIVAAGQKIPLAAPVAATKIGILGSATNADPGAQGTFTLTFTDGTSEQVRLGLSDWTLAANSEDPSYGNTIVAKTDYRDTTDGQKQAVTTYLFAATADVTGGKQVASITMPSTTTSGELHVFAFTVQ